MKRGMTDDEIISALWDELGRLKFSGARRKELEHVLIMREIRAFEMDEDDGWIDRPDRKPITKILNNSVPVRVSCTVLACISNKDGQCTVSERVRIDRNGRCATCELASQPVDMRKPRQFDFSYP